MTGDICNSYFGTGVGCVALGWMSFGMFTFYLPQLYLNTDKSLIQFLHISELEVSLQFVLVLLYGPIVCVLAGICKCKSNCFRCCPISSSR